MSIISSCPPGNAQCTRHSSCPDWTFNSESLVVEFCSLWITIPSSVMPDNYITVEWYVTFYAEMIDDAISIEVTGLDSMRIRWPQRHETTTEAIGRALSALWSPPSSTALAKIRGDIHSRFCAAKQTGGHSFFTQVTLSVLNVLEANINFWLVVRTAQ